MSAFLKKAKRQNRSPFLISCVIKCNLNKWKKRLPDKFRPGFQVAVGIRVFVGMVGWGRG